MSIDLSRARRRNGEQSRRFRSSGGRQAVSHDRQVAMGFLCMAVAGAAVLLLGACSHVVEASGSAADSIAPSATSSSTTTSSMATEASSSGTTGTAVPAPTRLPYTADWSSGLNGWTGGQGWTTSQGKLLSKEGADVIVAPLDLTSTNNYAVDADIQFIRPGCCGSSFGLVVRNSAGRTRVHDRVSHQ